MHQANDSLKSQIKSTTLSPLHQKKDLPHNLLKGNNLIIHIVMEQFGQEAYLRRLIVLLFDRGRKDQREHKS
jgi:hypothetical protein